MRRESCDKQKCEVSSVFNIHFVGLDGHFLDLLINLEEDNRCMRSHKVNFDRSGTEVTVHQKDFAATEISTMSEFSLVL